MTTYENLQRIGWLNLAKVESKKAQKAYFIEGKQLKIINFFKK